MANTDYEDDIFETLPFDEDEFYEAEIISLENEEGEIEEFEIVASVVYNDFEYFALLPFESEDTFDEESFLILKLVVDPFVEEGDNYITIEDEEEFSIVSGMLIEKLREDDYTVIE